MVRRFRQLVGITYPTSQRDQQIRSLRNAVASSNERITGDNLRNYGALAMQCYKHIFRQRHEA